MYQSKEVRAKLTSEDRQYKVRNTAFKVVRKAGLLNLASKIVNGEALKGEEVNTVIKVAKNIKPIPDSKIKLVWWALLNTQQNYNQFGQALK